MNRNEVEIDGTKILLSLFEKYKNEPWVLSSKEVSDKIGSVFFSGKWGQLNYSLQTPKFGLNSGVVLSYFDDLHFLVDKEKEVNRKFRTLNQIRDIFQIHNSKTIKINYVWDNCYMSMSEPVMVLSFCFKVFQLLSLTTIWYLPFTPFSYVDTNLHPSISKFTGLRIPLFSRLIYSFNLSFKNR